MTSGFKINIKPKTTEKDRENKVYLKNPKQPEVESQNQKMAWVGRDL